MPVVLAVVQIIGRLAIAGIFWVNFLAELWLIMLGKLAPSAFNFVILVFFLLLALVASYSSSSSPGAVQ